MAPLPGWGDLAAVPPGPRSAGADTARAWGGARDVDDGAASWLSRSAWAMRALVDWHAAAAGAPPSLWLPDYFCNQSTAPVREAGARLTFYPIGADLEPRWDECLGLAGDRPPDLFVLVHFFGYAADASRALDFCRRWGARLIEDAAHVLPPLAGVGAKGDFVFYSPHKVLAVPDGALLLARDAGEGRALAKAVSALGAAAPPTGAWLAKRLLQKCLPAPVLRTLARRRTPEFGDDPAYAPLPATPMISPLAGRLLARQTARLGPAAEARRRNARALGEALAGVPGCRLLHAAGEGDAAPYRLVVRCDDGRTAAALYGELRRRGCPVESWPDLPPEVLARPEAHRVAIELRRTLVLLPVHQSLETASLLSCCAPFK